MVETKQEMLYKNYFWDLKITKDSSQVIQVENTKKKKKEKKKF